MLPSCWRWDYEVIVMKMWRRSMNYCLSILKFLRGDLFMWEAVIWVLKRVATHKWVSNWFRWVVVALEARVAALHRVESLVATNITNERRIRVRKEIHPKCGFRTDWPHRLCRRRRPVVPHHRNAFRWGRTHHTHQLLTRPNYWSSHEEAVGKLHIYVAFWNST